VTPSPPARPSEVIEGSGRPVRGRALSQMVSVRWDPALLQAARLYAESKGLTISDVVRLAVTDYLEENSDDPPLTAYPLSWTGLYLSPNVRPVYGLP